MGYLDKDGLAHLWGKITDYVAQNSGDKPLMVPVKLSQSNWDSDNRQSVNIPEILADESKQLIIPTPTLSSQEAYYNFGIRVPKVPERSRF